MKLDEPKYEQFSELCGDVNRTCHEILGIEHKLEQIASELTISAKTPMESWTIMAAEAEGVRAALIAPKRKELKARYRLLARKIKQLKALDILEESK